MVSSVPRVLLLVVGMSTISSTVGAKNTFKTEADVVTSISVDERGTLKLAESLTCKLSKHSSVTEVSSTRFSSPGDIGTSMPGEQSV